MTALDGVSVLMTRPGVPGEDLAREIESHGGIALRAPMLVIDAPPDDSTAHRVAAEIESFDIAIFVSRNAVEYGLTLIAAADLAGREVYAVGPGTAGELAGRGVTDVQTPSHDFSSDGLLALDGFRESHLKERRVVIFRGNEGRETLADTLRTRGATVEYCECYLRGPPTVELSVVLSAHQLRCPDIGLATSLDALKNLADSIEREGQERLFGMPMLVVGSRIGAEVSALGFSEPPVIVANPSNDSIIKRLIRWAENEL